jgi:hypothetical protein
MEEIEYKIYQIVCNETKEVYFGKTTQTLEERLSKHKINNTTSSKQIIDRDNYYIQKIDSTFDEEESIILERFYIETFECINVNIPGRTEKEWREENINHLKKYREEYHKENKEYYIEYGKKYREENKEELSEYGKKYREENREQLKEYKKKYYEENSEHLKMKYTCECSSTLLKVNKARHERESQKHINFINSK